MKESGSEHGQSQDIFSVDGVKIGGPREFWKRITDDEIPVKGAWEFVNQEDESGNVRHFSFNLPENSMADIYIEEKGEEKVFTAFGSEFASLSKEFNVKKIQLYLNSSDWEKEHAGEWVEWENTGNDFVQGDNWQKLGQITSKDYTYGAPIMDEEPVNEAPFTEGESNGQPVNEETATGNGPSRHEEPVRRENKKNSNARKLAIAGAAVLAGAAILSSLQKNNDNQGLVNPNETDAPVPCYITPCTVSSVGENLDFYDSTNVLEGKFSKEDINNSVEFIWPISANQGIRGIQYYEGWALDGGSYYHNDPIIFRVLLLDKHFVTLCKSDPNDSNGDLTCSNKLPPGDYYATIQVDKNTLESEAKNYLNSLGEQYTSFNEEVYGVKYAWNLK